MMTRENKLKWIQFAALVVIMYRTNTDVICILCGLAMLSAAYAQGLFEEDGKNGRPKD